MRTLLGSLLGVIAVGVMLIAFGLLGPHAGALTTIDSQSTRTMPASGRVVLPDDAYGAGVSDAQQSAGSGLQLRCEPGQRAVIRNVGAATVAECLDGGLPGGGLPGGGYTTTRAALTYPVSEVRQYQPVVRTTPAVSQRPVRAASVERRSGRDWKKTAMVIGGSSAAGAGVGALFGGKKGPLIGARAAGAPGPVRREETLTTSDAPAAAPERSPQVLGSRVRPGCLFELGAGRRGYRNSSGVSIPLCYRR